MVSLLLVLDGNGPFCITSLWSVVSFHRSCDCELYSLHYTIIFTGESLREQFMLENAFNVEKALMDPYGVVCSVQEISDLHGSFGITTRTAYFVN